jgi:group I intron endonuclease
MADTKDLAVQQGKTTLSGVCGVYAIENLAKGTSDVAGRINGPVYVGHSTNVFKRFNAHRYMLRHNKHSSIRLQRAWNKYGEEAFSFHLLTDCPKEQLVEAEQFFMDEFEAVNLGYNVAPAAGSTFGVKITSSSHAQHLRDLSALHLGRKRSPEVCRNISEALKKAQASPEVRARMAESRRGIKHTDETKAINSQKSKEMWADPEIRARIVASCKGVTHKPRTIEQKARITAAQQARRARERAAKEHIHG